jgi:Flp pilus assembly protein TadG
MRLLRRLRDEAGQATIEFAGVLTWLLLAAFVMWQLLLVAWTYNQASNAARVASRVEARGGDPKKAGRQALSPGLRKHSRVKGVTTERYDVTVRVPLIVPSLTTKNLEITRSATLPG